MTTPDLTWMPQIDASQFVPPDPAEFERTLREKYQPILSPEDYARIRELCGLGPIIDGEVVEPPRAIEQTGVKP